MLKIYINLKKYAEYSTFTINKGFIKIPSKFQSICWINRRQFQIADKEAREFIEYLKENNAEIFYRYSREDDWTKYEYKGGTNDEN